MRTRPRRPLSAESLDDVVSAGRGFLIVVLSAMLAAPAWAYSLRPVCPTVEAADYFFPAGVLVPSRPDSDRFARAWYSKHLRVMGEPSLSCGPPLANETYRFVWLRTFNRPIAVRLSSEGASFRLVAVELTGAGGYDPGSISTRAEKMITESDWRALAAALARIGFWSMPSREAKPGIDGSRWIVEGVRPNSGYHIVDRWSPKEGSYRDAGLLFLTLAGIVVPDDERY
jgi:hypothetical protein